MRVLMTTDAVGGVWQYSLALARGLVEQHGCQIALVCFGEPPERDVAEAIPDRAVELVPLRYKLEWMPDSARDVQESLNEIRRLCSLWQPDVVHSNQFCFGLLETRAPRIVVAHSDVLSWTSWQRAERSGETPSPSLAWLDEGLLAYRDLVSAGLAGASEVVCPSRFMARSLAAMYGRAARVIYNGLWPDRYRRGSNGACDAPPPDGEALPEAVSSSPPSSTMPEGTAYRVRAALAGRLWDEAKRAGVAVRAVEGLPVELRLVGPTIGPTGEKCHLPTAANALYLGPRSWQETREVIAAARLYLATSSYEPFGLAALEAAFSGCALLVNDIPGYRELWDGAAIFFQRDDASDLRRVIIRLLETPGEIDRLGRAARDRALERYRAERMATEYFDLYSSMLAVDARPRTRG